VNSGGGDEDEFRILVGRDDEFGLIDSGGAIADSDPLPVDEDRALARCEIGIPKPVERMRDRFPARSVGTSVLL
jgi:hypothetical protein